MERSSAGGRWREREKRIRAERSLVRCYVNVKLWGVPILSLALMMNG